MQSPIVMINLLSAVYWFDDALQAHLRAGGWEPTTRAQSLLIANLAAGETRASRLAENLGVSRQAISQMLAEMEARRLIKSEPDPTDKRARIVQLHPEETALREEANRILRMLEATLAERIGADQVEALRRAFAADWGPSPEPEVVS